MSVAMATLEPRSPLSFPVSSHSKIQQHYTYTQLVPYVATPATPAIKIHSPQTTNSTVQLEASAHSSISSPLQSSRSLEELKQAHGQMIKLGKADNIDISSKLIYAYSRFRSVGDAKQIFDKTQEKPSAFLWNTMIKVCTNNGLYRETIELYNQMQSMGIQPDMFTFPLVIKACAGLLVLEEGRKIHELILRNGDKMDCHTATALITMYAKCGFIEDAREVFEKMRQRDLRVWDAMIGAYLEIRDAYGALRVFGEMQMTGMRSDYPCLGRALVACKLIRALDQGKCIHGLIIRCGFESNIRLGTALLDMYAQCGCIDDAHQVFDKIRQRDVFLWNTMIGAYARNGFARRAVELFRRMHEDGLKPNKFTLVGVIPAFAELGSVEHGKWIHDYVIRSGLESNAYIASAIINMYAKCGSMEMAREVFDKMSKKDVTSWTALIAGYAMHGHGEQALAVFSEMQEAGVKPDHITFVSVLSACSHAGLLDEGWRYFDLMASKFGIQPRMENYTCMVHLLGRAGRLEEAYDFIKKMPLEPDAYAWGALLGACKIHSNTELAEHAAQHLFNLDPKNPVWYVMLCDIYAAARRWDDVKKMKRRMEEKGFRKSP